MKLSKSSWHWKFNNFMDWSNQRRFLFTTKFSLCQYFWLTVFNVTIKLPILIFCACAFTMVVGWLVYLAIYPVFVWLFDLAGVILPVIGGDHAEFVTTGKVVSLLIAVVTLFVVRKVNEVGRMYDERKKKPNIFFEYLKARKDKICPIMEVVDNDK